jgi:hypothetical protein
MTIVLSLLLSDARKDVKKRESCSTTRIGLLSDLFVGLTFYYVFYCERIY